MPQNPGAERYPRICPRDRLPPWPFSASKPQLHDEQPATHRIPDPLNRPQPRQLTRREYREFLKVTTQHGTNGRRGGTASELCPQTAQLLDVSHQENPLRQAHAVLPLRQGQSSLHVSGAEKAAGAQAASKKQATRGAGRGRGPWGRVGSQAEKSGGAGVDAANAVGGGQ